MEARPVLIDRAPVLHKYGIMAFKPKLTQSHTLQINPIVTKGFGADFDGDQMNYHVPADDSAVEEALYKMLPSSNLFSTSSFKAHYLPNQEYIGGLYAASSQKNDKRPRRFATKADAYRAIKSGDVGVDDPIEIVQN
jgi:DNA-directed RNA polymerase subunit beta'